MKTKRAPKKTRLAKLAERAMRQGVAEAIAECKRKGLPIPIWKNDKIVLLPSKEVG